MRCAGFLWQHAGRSSAIGGRPRRGRFLPLAFERVAPVTRSLDQVATDVYQHACWPIDATSSVVTVMTTVPRPKGISYVVRAANSVVAEALPLILVYADGIQQSRSDGQQPPPSSSHAESSIAADWAFAQPGGVRFVRVPETVSNDAAAAVDESAGVKMADLLMSRSSGPRRIGGGRAPSPTSFTSASRTYRWRAHESAHWAWSVQLALTASDAPFVLYMEDDVVLAQGAADALMARLREWTARSHGSSNATGAADRAMAARLPPVDTSPRKGGIKTMTRRASTPQPPIPDFPEVGWLGLSLWSADDEPDGHACANCYTKALVLPRHNAAVLAAHVAQRVSDKPVDWLIGDVERAGGGRLRALVPNLAEHVGDQSSLAGLRREWQRSAWFKKHTFKGSGEGATTAPYKTRDPL